MKKTIWCMLLLSALYGHSATGMDAVDEIFVAQRRNFIRLKSLSMVYSEDWDPGEYVKTHTDSPLLRHPAHLVIGVQKENEKYRVDQALDGTKVHAEQEDSIIKQIAAFNLEKYQTLQKRTLHLRVQSLPIGLADKINLPLIRPLLPLFTATRSIEDMQNAETWETLKEHARVTGNATVGGHDCVKMEISFPNRAQLCQVYWAKDLGYYPVKHELFNLDGKKLIEITVKEVIKKDTTEGLIFIPMIIEETQWHEARGHRTWTLKHSVDSNSLSVNEDIPDEVFTIPLHMAKSYEDADDIDKGFSMDYVVEETLEDLDPFRAELTSSGQDDIDKIDKPSETNTPSDSTDSNTVTPATSTPPDQEIGKTSEAGRSSANKYFYFVALLIALGVLVLLSSIYRHKSNK